MVNHTFTITRDMQVLIVCGILLMFPISWAAHSCPSKEDLQICTCKHAEVEERLTTLPTFLSNLSSTAAPPPIDYLRIIVECKMPPTISSLVEVDLVFHRQTVDKLILSHIPAKKEHAFVRLPSAWLKNTRVKILEIHETRLPGDFIRSGNSFYGQEQSLLYMVIRNCHLYGSLSSDVQGTTNTKYLNEFVYLEGLDLSHNYLSFVVDSAFSSPPQNLATIILSHNNLQSIGTNAFLYVSKLKYINLSHNLLEVMNRRMFPPNAKLEEINLSWNMLKELPSDFFNNMPNLKRVNLERNFLYSMPERPWKLVWKSLEFVDVTGNFIYCDCDLLWLLPFIPIPEGQVSHQTIRGQCSEDKLSSQYTTRHELSTLTRQKLLC